MITHKQLSLKDIFTDCQKKFDNDKYQFLVMLDEAIDMDEIVPVSFVTHFHALTGRPRKHLLYPMLKALLLQRIFSIPTDTLLIVFLKYSQELRDFCGFSVVPDASKFTRFKQDFLPDLQAMFDNLVDLTEPICQNIDPSLASMTIFDTSGIEAWVTENNPKYANRIIKQLKAFKKAKGLDDSYDPYKAAYASLPPHAEANPAIQQMYINGHFCYAYKFGLVTNGLGIVRNITFYNKDFLQAHPDIVVEKKSDSPDEDKSLAACTRLSTQRPSWGTPPLTPYRSTMTSSTSSISKRLSSHSTAGSPWKIPTAPLMKTASPAVHMTLPSP